MRVAFTPLAERQLDSLHRYIAERAGESVADGYVGRIVAFWGHDKIGATAYANLDKK